MTLRSIDPERSFFDLSSDPLPFWKRIEATDFSDYPKYLESEFHIPKAKSLQNWDTCILTLQNNFLVFRKKKNAKEVEYIDLEEHIYKIILILPTDQKYFAKYKNAFTIYANGSSFDFYCKEKTQLTKWLIQFRRFCAMTDFFDNYKNLEILGSGGYGEVRRLQDNYNKSFKAGKFITMRDSKDSRVEKQKVMVLNEIRILRKLDHPNIVKLYEIYELENEICLVMELVEGERLLDHVTKVRKVVEKEAALFMKQLFLTLNYLRTMDIIHRDIKTENIMLIKDKSGKPTLKLLDFGLSTFHHKRDIIKRCGTPGYVAPEIINNEPYDFKADLYSMGVILYICLTGRPPYVADNHKDLLEKNKKGVIQYRNRDWSHISIEAKLLVQRMLDPNSTSRASLEEIISHEWLLENLAADEKNHLLEYAFCAVKMDVPSEKKSATVPVSTGLFSTKQQIPVENTSRGSMSGSHSFLMSHMYGGGEQSATRLNSFYKNNISRESSCSGEGGSSDSINKRGFKSPTAKEKKSFFPNPASNLSVSQRSSEKSTGYGIAGIEANRNAKRRTSDIYDDEMQIPEEDGLTCGQNYVNLAKMDLCFDKPYTYKNTQ